MARDDIEAQLGPLLDTFRGSKTYRLIASAVAIPLCLLGLYTATRGSVDLGLGIAGIFGVSWGLIMWTQGRRLLFLHKNGLRLQTAMGSKVVLWSRVEEIRGSFSAVVEPRTMIDLAFRQAGVSRVALRMTWQRRADLAAQLWPVVSTHPHFRPGVVLVA